MAILDPQIRIKLLEIAEKVATPSSSHRDEASDNKYAERIGEVYNILSEKINPTSS